MLSTIAHPLPTDAQPVPEQLLPPSQLSSALLFFHWMPYGVEGPFGQFGSPALVLSPPSSMCPPAPRWQGRMRS